MQFNLARSFCEKLTSLTGNNLTANSMTIYMIAAVRVEISKSEIVLINHEK